MTKQLQFSMIGRYLALLLIFALFSHGASAEIASGAIYETVLDAYHDRASGWKTVMLSSATWLYWSLVTISLAWTFGLMALKKSDLGEFFLEFIKFIMTTGFFFWLLSNGPDFGDKIIQSMRQIGAQASGSSGVLTPGTISEMGFDVFFRILDSISYTSPGTAIVSALLGLGILLVISLIAVNMLILLCAGWILVYAGVFFLGFGGGRWTTDIAINYYKTVLGLGTQLMSMVLLVGIGTSIMDGYYSKMSQGISLPEVAVLFVVALILYRLTNQVPGMISGIITGAGIRGGDGGFGAGAALGAMGMAGAAVAAGGAMLGAAAQNGVGAGTALKAAFDMAQTNMDTGSGAFSGMGAGGSGSGPSLSKAMGTASMFAADMASTLGQGIAAVAKDSMQEMKDNFMNGKDANQSAAGDTPGGVAATFPGRVATAINDKNESKLEDSGSAGEFDGDSVGGGDEYSDFVNKTT